MERRWYAVHTYAGHENKVKTTIERRADSMNLRDKISRIIIPTETELRTRGGKKREIQRKIFPGYILVEMVLDDSTWHLIKSTTGVTGFVSSGNKPVPLQDSEVANILQTVEGPRQKPKVQWEAGQVIRVTSGPFADFTGTIQDVIVPKEKVRVLISLFGRDTPVELDFTQVEKI